LLSLGRCPCGVDAYEEGDAEEIYPMTRVARHDECEKDCRDQLPAREAYVDLVLDDGILATVSRYRAFEKEEGRTVYPLKSGSLKDSCLSRVSAELCEETQRSSNKRPPSQARRLEQHRLTMVAGLVLDIQILLNLNIFDFG
jgi:hypothetical protein